MGNMGFSPCYTLQLARRFQVETQVFELGLEGLADYNSIYSEIENLMQLDHKDQFAAFLTKYHDKLLSFTPQELFSLLVTHSAVGCLTALLDSQLRSHFDVNQRICQAANFPLEFAAYKLCFPMVTLLLQHGADPHALSSDGFPLKFAIQTFSSLVDWNPEKSIVELFNLICSPQMKESLNTVKVLPSQSKQVENLCFNYVAYGEVIKFATLLTVASDKLLVHLEKGLENTPLGQYIFGELKCEANQLCERTSNWISSSKKKNLVDAFNVVKTFCLIHGLHERSGQLVLEDLSKLVREGWLVREPTVKDNIESLLSKLTSEARVLSQKHYGSILPALTGERRMGIAGFSILPLRSKFLDQGFCTRQGAHFSQHLKPSLVKKVAPIMWLAKRTLI